MATFAELQQKIASAKFKKTVLSHLIEYVDERFRASGGEEPKSCLLTDERVAVPQDVFESVVTGLLLKTSKDLDEEISAILGTTLRTQETAAPQPAHEIWASQESPPPQQQAAVLPFLQPIQAPVSAQTAEPTRTPRTRSRNT